jgi:hypothetical protein
MILQLVNEEEIPVARQYKKEVTELYDKILRQKFQ